MSRSLALTDYFIYTAKASHKHTNSKSETPNPKFGKNPVTGTPLKLDQLFKLKMTKDEDDNYICPVSKKVLTDSSKIVAIRGSGVVYAASTVEELNKKPKFFCDLVTGQKFTPSDIIVIQDPMDVKSRMMENFDYVRNQLEVGDDESEEAEDGRPDVDHTALGKRVLSLAEEKAKVYAMEQAAKAAATAKRIYAPLSEEVTVEDFIAERRELKDWLHEKEGTGRLASSVTSSYMKLTTSEEKRPLTELEMMQYIWLEAKKTHAKGYAQIITNQGEMNVLLFTDQTPRTCSSFMDLAYKGKFKGIKFRSLVPGTLLSVGSYGQTDKIMFQTLDKSEKLFHKKPALLTINTMGSLSSFGVTLSESELLDRTNTIFGEIKHNFEVVDLVDASGAEDGHPKKKLEIEDVKIMEDPFRQICTTLRQKLMGYDVEAAKAFANKQAQQTKEAKIVDKITKTETAKKIVFM